jgi:hypothetical protein
MNLIGINTSGAWQWLNGAMLTISDNICLNRIFGNNGIIVGWNLPRNSRRVTNAVDKSNA